MPILEAKKPKDQHLFQRHKVEADANGDIPSQIEVVRAGQWGEDSNKGMLYITPDDLQEMAANFAAGIGCAGGLNQLPIDFSHNDYDEAAGWITKLTVQGDVLMADVEWSDSGLTALAGKRFKFFSPSFYPGCLGEWCDPEDWSLTARNVLVGGALTNIPFFKNLQPVMASNNSQEGELKNLIFVDASAKGASMPTLEEVRVKASLDDLNEDEKTLLVEHKDELNADEKIKFGFETAAKPIDADAKKPVGEQITADQRKVLADIASGTVKVVAASEYDELTSTVSELKGKIEADEDAKIAAELDTHVAAGRIKADAKGKWLARVKADRTLMDDLAAMPADPSLAEEKGGTGDIASAVQELRDKTAEIVKADSTIDAAKAMTQARAENPELAKAADAEMKGTN